MPRQKWSEISAALTIIRGDERARNHANKVRIFKKRLQRMADELEESSERMWTGWYVLLCDDSKAESGYKFLGFFNPDKSSEDEEPEWDAAVPIATPETIPEFDGW